MFALKANLKIFDFSNHATTLEIIFFIVLFLQIFKPLWDPRF